MLRTRVGYAGGTTRNPTYHNLGDHSETLQIDYDPAGISYEALLGIFWGYHDPTYPRLSRQYMSAIFYHSEDQKRSAFESGDREASRLNQKVFTEIISFTEFYIAEDYHQKYALQRNPELMREFKAMYPSFKRIVSSTAAARVNGYLAGYGTLKNLRAEIDSYGLSDTGRSQLLSVIKASQCIPCRR